MAEVMIGMEDDDSGNQNRIIKTKSEEEYKHLLNCQKRYRDEPPSSSEEEYHLLAYIQEEYMQLKQKDQYFGRKEFFKILLSKEKGHDDILYETSPREFRVKGFPPDDTSQENLDEELEKKIKEDLKNLETILKKKKQQNSPDYDFEDFDKDVLRERDIRPAAENQNHKSEIKVLKKALALSVTVIIFLLFWIVFS